MEIWSNSWDHRLLLAGQLLAKSRAAGPAVNAEEDPGAEQGAHQIGTPIADKRQRQTGIWKNPGGHGDVQSCLDGDAEHQAGS